MFISTRNDPKNGLLSHFFVFHNETFLFHKNIERFGLEGTLMSARSKVTAMGMETSVMTKFPQYPQNYLCVVHTPAHAGCTPGM